MPDPPPSLAHRLSRLLLGMEWFVIVLPVAVIGLALFAWFGFWGVTTSSIVGWHGSVEQAAPLLALTGGVFALSCLLFAYVGLVTALTWAYVRVGRRSMHTPSWPAWVGLVLLVVVTMVMLGPIVGPTPLLVVLLPALHLLAARGISAAHVLRARKAGS